MAMARDPLIGARNMPRGTLEKNLNNQYINYSLGAILATGCTLLVRTF
jgi:hypothetical protein